jgi:hypothetical protein
LVLLSLRSVCALAAAAPSLRALGLLSTRRERFAVSSGSSLRMTGEKLTYLSILTGSAEVEKQQSVRFLAGTT